MTVSLGGGGGIAHGQMRIKSGDFMYWYRPSSAVPSPDLLPPVTSLQQQMDSKDSHGTSGLAKDHTMGCFSFLCLIKRQFSPRKLDPTHNSDSTATQVKWMVGQEPDEPKALEGVLSSLLIGNM